MTEESDSGINNDVFEERNFEGNVNYYVWADNENDARRKLKRYKMLNGEGLNIINIKLSTNKPPQSVYPNVGCNQDSTTAYQMEDICYNSCQNISTVLGISEQWCQDYHTNF